MQIDNNSSDNPFARTLRCLHTARVDTTAHRMWQPMCGNTLKITEVFMHTRLSLRGILGASNDSFDSMEHANQKGRRIKLAKSSHYDHYALHIFHLHVFALTHPFCWTIIMITIR